MCGGIQARIVAMHALHRRRCQSRALAPLCARLGDWFDDDRLAA